MAKNKEKEFIYGLMEANIREIGLIIKLVEKEFIIGQVFLKFKMK